MAKQELYDFKMYSIGTLEKQMPSRTIFELSNFMTKFFKIEKALADIAQSDLFIVLITAQGARGIDIKGKNPAHVIICYKPSPASECTQALGRGSRSLDSHADGIIVCDNKIETRAEQYLKFLEKFDYERTMNTEVHMTVAKMLH
jgi:hypothetical protein